MFTGHGERYCFCDVAFMWLWWKAACNLTKRCHSVALWVMWAGGFEKRMCGIEKCEMLLNFEKKKNKMTEILQKIQCAIRR